jgi:hypothetical protein
VRGGSDFNREDLYKVERWNCRGEDEGLNERCARVGDLGQKPETESLGLSFGHDVGKSGDR